MIHLSARQRNLCLRNTNSSMKLVLLLCSLILFQFCGQFTIAASIKERNVISRSVKNHSNKKSGNVKSGVIISQSERLQPWNRKYSQLRTDGERSLNSHGVLIASTLARAIAATAVQSINVDKIALQLKQDAQEQRTVRDSSLIWAFLLAFHYSIFSSIVNNTTKSAIIKIFKGKKTPLPSLSDEEGDIHDDTNNLKLLFASAKFQLASHFLSTLLCSILSTPHTVLMTTALSGQYPSFLTTATSLWRAEGLKGMYKGWICGVTQQYSSYVLTRLIFQQFKNWFLINASRPGTVSEYSLLGAIAASVVCILLVPLDTVKTRLITQKMSMKEYTGISDGLYKIAKKEGILALYRAVPYLIGSVVVMILLQSTIFEVLKRIILQQPTPKRMRPTSNVETQQ
jgi:hypothetical protein